MTVEYFPGPDAGTWTVPAGVFSVFVEAHGGGADGVDGYSGDSLQVGGDGGGGGGYGAATLVVIPGSMYSWNAGGPAVTSDFGPGIVRGGGATGSPFVYSGGTDNIGTTTINGEDGDPSPMIDFGPGADGGAGAGGGGGGIGGAGDELFGFPGTDGGFPGGGGGGGGGGLLSGGVHGAGASGYMRFTYTVIYLGSPSPPINSPGSPIVPGNTITIPSVPGMEGCLDTITSVTFNGIPASFSIVTIPATVCDFIPEITLTTQDVDCGPPDSKTLTWNGSLWTAVGGVGFCNADTVTYTGSCWGRVDFNFELPRVYDIPDDNNTCDNIILYNSSLHDKSVVITGFTGTCTNETKSLVITVPSGVSGSGILEVTSGCGIMDFAYVAAVNNGNIVAICCKVCAVSGKCPPWMVKYGSSVRTRG